MDIHVRIAEFTREIAAMDVYGLVVLAVEIFIVVVLVRLFLMAWDAIMGRLRR